MGLTEPASDPFTRSFHPRSCDNLRLNNLVEKDSDIDHVISTSFLEHRDYGPRGLAKSITVSLAQCFSYNKSFFVINIDRF